MNGSPTAVVAANNLAWLYQEDNEKLDDALRLAQLAAARMPDSAEVQDTIGMIYFRKELPALAISAFERSVEKSPDSADYHYHLAMALAKAGEPKRAREAAEQAIKLKPDFADAQKLLAQTKG
jgi:tetratricopeptide (TPR) repeat protein